MSVLTVTCHGEQTTEHARTTLTLTFAFKSLNIVVDSTSLLRVPTSKLSVSAATKQTEAQLHKTAIYTS